MICNIFLREHFKTAHRTPQCERCYSFFKDLSELTSHRQAGSCPRNPDELKEGIDDSQMEKIEDLLKVKKRGMSDSDKRQHDIDIWFAIWEVLLPGLDRPAHPCKSFVSACQPRAKLTQGLGTHKFR